MNVTDIEVHRIALPYVDWISYQLNHYYGPTSRTKVSIRPVAPSFLYHAVQSFRAIDRRRVIDSESDDIKND